MKNYKLYICMPVVKFKVTVSASSVISSDGMHTFYNESEIVAIYPINYTCIEKIEKWQK